MALDIGDSRIGVARGSAIARMAEGLVTLEVDGHEVEALKSLVKEHDIDYLVVGLPRNQSGDETEQTKKTYFRAEQFSEELELQMSYQDESLTSVNAEKLLKLRNKPYHKSDIDRVAAELILQDFLDNL